jgi:hypothetical protein
MERRLTLPFRSVKHTYCYSSSHALTLTYSSNVKWLFIIVEQKSKKKKEEIEVDVHTHTFIQLSLSDIDYAYIDDSLISFKHQIMYIEEILVFGLNMKHVRTLDKKHSWGVFGYALCRIERKRREKKNDNDDNVCVYYYPSFYSC